MWGRRSLLYHGVQESRSLQREQMLLGRQKQDALGTNGLRMGSSPTTSASLTRRLCLPQ